MSDEANLAFLRQLSARFPNQAASISMGVEWERRGLIAGVSIAGAQIAVYLGSATKQVASYAEAADMLSAVFANRLALITGYAGGDPVYFDIAPPTDAAAGISALDKTKSSIEVPMIEEFEATTWSVVDSE